MAAGHIQVAPDSTGAKVDTSVLTSTESGTPTVHRQDFVLADPVNYANEAKVGAGGDLSASITSPAAAALGMFGSVTPYGSMRVSGEPFATFFDPIDGASIDVANRWNVGGTQVPTQAASNIVVAPAVGVNVANSSVLTSQPSFASSGFGLDLIGFAVTLEAAQVPAVNVHRFAGKGQVTAYAYATPLTDGVGWEIEGTLGALQCVVYIAGVKYVLNSTNAALISSSVAGAGGSGTALPAGAAGTNFGQLLPWKGGIHRYAVFERSDAVFWFSETLEVPVALVQYATPAVQLVPVRVASITNPAATSLAHTFQVSAIGVGDSSGQNPGLADGTYPWRKASVSATGALKVAGEVPSAGTPANVASSASSVTLLAANTARKQATVYNDSTAALYLLLGAGPASATSYTVQLPPAGFYTLDWPVYTGQVTGIWSAANGFARVTELT